MEHMENTTVRSAAKGILGLLICATLLATISACTRAPEEDGPLVATHRDGVVTAADYDRWLEARKLREPAENPRVEIEQLVLVRTLAASAVSRGLDRQPDLAFQLQLTEERSLHAAFTRRLAESVAISEEEIDALVAANPEAFSKPRRVRLYNIFKRIEPDASEEERSRLRRQMEKIRAELIAGSNFGKMAFAESESETRYHGGRMGVIAQGELPPAIDAIVMKMTKDELSPILTSTEGLTILKCGGVFEAEKASPEEMKSKTRTNLMRIRYRENQQQLTAETLANSGLEIDMGLAMDPSTAGDEVIARFGSHVLTLDQLNLIVASRRPANRRSAPLNEQLVRESTEMYVTTVLMAQRAREAGMNDEKLNAEVFFQQQRLLATEDLRLRVDARLVEPSPSEIEAYFDTHRSTYQHPMTTDLMMIGFLLDDRPATMVHAEAASALDAIDSGELSFEEAVARYSERETTGSPISTLTPRQLAGYGEAVGNAARRLAPGQVSRVIRQDDHLWIVKLVDRHPPQPLAFDEVRDRVRRDLGQERVDSLTAEIETEVIEEQQISLVGNDP